MFIEKMRLQMNIIQDLSLCAYGTRSALKRDIFAGKTE